MANDKNFIVKNGIQVGSTLIANDTAVGALSGASLTNLTAGNLSGTIPSGVLGNSKLSVHASTSSSELAGVISDETGTGNLVFSSAATLTGTTLNGNTNFDSGTLFIDSVNDRVGVGNTAPAQKFVVTGDTYINGNMGIGGAPNSNTKLIASRTLNVDGDAGYTIYSYLNDTNTAMTAARTKTSIQSDIFNDNENLSSDGLTRYNAAYYGGTFRVYNGKFSTGGNASASYMNAVTGAIYNYANGSSSNTVTAAVGLVGQVRQGGTGVITNATAVGANVLATADTITGNITTAYGVNASITSNTAMTIGTGYLYYGTYAGATTTAKYGVFINGEANNYFSGNLSVGGSVIVTGNLTINGTMTTINSTTLSVDDKNLVLGAVTTPTDTTADGGGITLKGATDKTFNWISATNAWTSSEDLNLITGKAYEIGGASVLNATTLGTGVVTSSLTQVGTIGNGVWQGTAVAGQYGGTGVINTGKTITLGGNISTANSLTTSGNFALTLTATAATNVTLPTTGTLATTSNKLSAFAATTSAELAGVISDETGSGNLVFSSAATLTGTALNGNTNFDSATLFVDGTNNLTLIGTTVGYPARYTSSSVNTEIANADFQIHGTGNGLKASMIHWGTGSVGSKLQLGKSKGAIGTQSAVAAGDALGDLQFVGSDGETFVIGALIRSEVEGTPAANNVASNILFRTANTGSGSTHFTRMQVSSNGNVGIANTTPTSTLHVTGTASVSGNTTVGGSLSISSGEIVSGTYAPTITIVTNTNTAAAANTFNYMRVGNVITVSGVLNANVTTINSDATVAVSLPIASNFVNGFEGSGIAAPTTAAFAAENGVIIADATNDRMSVNFRSTTTTLKGYAVHFTYRVL